MKNILSFLPKITLAFKKLNAYFWKMRIENPTPLQSMSWFLSVKEYADLKKVSVQSVYGKIKRCTIEVKKIGNLTLVRDI